MGACFLICPQGIDDVLCAACAQLKWKTPSTIQREALPVALEGTCACVSHFSNRIAFENGVNKPVNTIGLCVA